MIAKIILIMILAFMCTGLLIALFGDTETFRAIDSYIADCINRLGGSDNE